MKFWQLALLISAIYASPRMDDALAAVSSFVWLVAGCISIAFCIWRDK